MTANDAWVCPSCGKAVTTDYCPDCGERSVSARDLSLRGLAHQVAQAMTSIDGRLLRSMRELLVRPGALTVAYLEGHRKPFIGPFQLFLILNVLFFAVQSLIGTHVFSTPLDSHLHQQDWSTLARDLVDGFLARHQLTLEQYAPVFDEAVETNAKALVVLMVPPFALAAASVFARRGRPAVTHMVFSLHFHGFLLVLFALALGVVALDVGLGGAGLASRRFDQALGAAMLAACSIYLYLSGGIVYGSRGPMRLLQTMVLTIAVAVIVTGYRFLLLPITLLTT